MRHPDVREFCDFLRLAVLEYFNFVGTQIRNVHFLPISYHRVDLDQVGSDLDYVDVVRFLRRRLLFGRFRRRRQGGLLLGQPARRKLQTEDE